MPKGMMILEWYRAAQNLLISSYHCLRLLDLTLFVAGFQNQPFTAEGGQICPPPLPKSQHSFSFRTRVKFFTSKCIYRSRGVTWNTFEPIWSLLDTPKKFQKNIQIPKFSSRKSQNFQFFGSQQKTIKDTRKTKVQKYWKFCVDAFWYKNVALGKKFDPPWGSDLTPPPPRRISFIIPIPGIRGPRPENFFYHRFEEKS